MKVEVKEGLIPKLVMKLGYKPKDFLKRYKINIYKKEYTLKELKKLAKILKITISVFFLKELPDFSYIPENLTNPKHILAIRRLNYIINFLIEYTDIKSIMPIEVDKKMSYKDLRLKIETENKIIIIENDLEDINGITYYNEPIMGIILNKYNSSKTKKLTLLKGIEFLKNKKTSIIEVKQERIKKNKKDISNLILVTSLELLYKNEITLVDVLELLDIDLKTFYKII